MDNKKPLDFNGTAGSYFVLSLVTGILAYIPIFGWALALNYASGWYADRTLVTGRKIVFKAGYMEALKFMFINTILLVITFGIYIFWFVPKTYRYFTEHIQYDDQVEPAYPTVNSAPVQPATPIDPTQPPASVPPVAS
jgi:uncharacterized membrane protein YjgN (DUF898 family)